MYYEVVFKHDHRLPVMICTLLFFFAWNLKTNVDFEFQLKVRIESSVVKQNRLKLLNRELNIYIKLNLYLDSIINRYSW